MTEQLMATMGGLTLAASRDYVTHLSRLGRTPALTSQQLVKELKTAGLLGRGGAGFPTATKLASLPSRRGVVIGNGSEGEPASAKDRWLLAAAPHLVLDGLTVVGDALSARMSLVVPRNSAASVTRAIAERGKRSQITVVTAGDRFVSGQETAVVSALEGRRDPRPRTANPPLRHQGAHNRPTVVLNVETLAHTALIARYGGEWFRSRGTSEDPGSRLFTVSGAVRRPGVIEASGGTALEAVLEAAGGPSRPLSAVLVGGYHGTWLPWSPETRHLPLTPAHLAAHDAAVGAGVLIALPADRCALQAAADIAGYLAGESAGQCGPCRFGLPALASALRTLAYDGGNPGRVSEIRRLSSLVVGRGACRHPDGTARFVRSTLAVFTGELSLHAHGRCTGGVRR
jgi:NADH:ubiquinone oxidoreductase subunit F (NADH-binding)